jgi:hypothetical protein
MEKVVLLQSWQICQNYHQISMKQKAQAGSFWKLQTILQCNS